MNETLDRHGTHSTRRPTSSSSPCARLVAIATLLLICCASLFYVVQSEEIDVTNEWQLLQENDTIPKGVHIRMDLGTGQKWVKLIDDDDDIDEQNSGATTMALDEYGNVISIQNTAQQQQQSISELQEQHEEEEHYDYDMMYRTLSKVPKEEFERMGGLPERPDASSTRQERYLFQERMKQIWLQRQAELMKIMEESVVNFPQVLLDRITSIQSFIQEPHKQIQHLVNSGSEDAEDNNTHTVDGTNIVAVLKDLEYQLSDVDMARDFYTMGGWPLLLTLLSNDLYAENCKNVTLADGVRCVVDNDGDDDHSNSFLLQLKVNEIQTLSAWIIGTMFKNIQEFHPLAVGEVSLALPPSSTTTTVASTSSNNSSRSTVLSLLVKSFVNDDDNNSISATATAAAEDTSSISLSLMQSKLTKSVNDKRQKVLYALGSLLRGNKLAQQYFASRGHAFYLAKSLEDFYVYHSSHRTNIDASTPNNIIDSKTAKRIIALADDIVSENVIDINNDTSESDNNDNKIIIDAFTTKLWCDTSRQLLLLVNDSLVGERKNNIASLEESILRKLNTVGPYCVKKDKKYQKQAYKTIKKYRTKCSLTLGLADEMMFGLTTDESNEEDSIIERLQLADVVLKTIVKS